MGTSTSSMGPGAGVSLDPEWLDDIDIPNTGNIQSDQQKIENDENENLINNNTQDNIETPDLAPKFRFANARRGMGEYARLGSKESLRKSLGHYSKTGMGGAEKLSERMRISTKVASNFFHAFQSLRDNEKFSLGELLSELKKRGANANEIIDTIIDNVCPKGGSLDEVSCKDSGRVALSQFMKRNPDADFCELTDDQIWSLTSIFLGNEAFNRVQLDIGQCFEKQDIPVVERVNRMNEMKDYLQSEISVQLNLLRNSEHQIYDMQKLFQKAIKNTFEIYEVEV